jgi:phage tail tape-measure protein
MMVRIASTSSVWLGVFLAALAATVLGSPGVTRAQGASSYQLSCMGIGVSGATLFGQCRRLNGSWASTSIQIRGVQNINGMLQFGGMGQPSSFQLTCVRIRVAGDMLSAQCRRVDGSYRRTSIPIQGIANIDGTMRYQ